MIFGTMYFSLQQSVLYLLYIMFFDYKHQLFVQYMLQFFGIVSFIKA